MRNALIIIAVAIALLAITYSITFLGGWLWNRNFVFMAVFLVMLTFTTDQINLQALHQQGRAVITPYLISTVLKLLLSIGFLMVIVKLNPSAVKELVIAFLTYYAVFSTLEIFLVKQRTKK